MELGARTTLDMAKSKYSIYHLFLNGHFRHFDEWDTFARGQFLRIHRLYVQRKIYLEHSGYNIFAKSLSSIGVSEISVK